MSSSCCSLEDLRHGHQVALSSLTMSEERLVTSFVAFLWVSIGFMLDVCGLNIDFAWVREWIGVSCVEVIATVFNVLSNHGFVLVVFGLEIDNFSLLSCGKQMSIVVHVSTVTSRTFSFVFIYVLHTIYINVLLTCDLFFSMVSSSLLKISGPYKVKVCNCGLKALRRKSWTDVQSLMENY